MIRLVDDGGDNELLEEVLDSVKVVGLPAGGHHDEVELGHNVDELPLVADSQEIAFVARARRFDAGRSGRIL